MKIIKNNIDRIFGVFFILFIIGITVSVSAADHTLAINSTDINVVSEGTITSPKYYFSLKANSNTTTEIWGNTPKTLYTKTNYRRDVVMLPDENSVPGTFGVWIYNAGVYQGKSIDVKTTYYWQDLTIDGVTIYPTLMLSLGKDGKIAQQFTKRSYEVKYELFSEGKPLSVNMSLTLGDIDSYQFFGVKNNSGSINSISCIDYANIYYKYLDNYHWTYAGSAISYDGLEATTRFEMSDTSSFNIYYGADQDLTNYNYTFLRDEDIPLNTYKNSLLTIYNLVKNWFDLYNDGDSDLEWLKNGSGNYYGGWGYFDATAYGPYGLPDPTKTVSDSDEINVHNNTIIKNDGMTYSISQSIPQEMATYYYDSFALQDQIPQGLEVISYKVMYEGKDATDLFEYKNEDNLITFIAKDTSVSSFYNTTYIFYIEVKVKTENLSSNDKVSDNQYQLMNKVKAIITRSSKTESSESNEVKTIVDLGGPTIITDVPNTNSNRYFLIVLAIICFGYGIYILKIAKV